MLPVLIVYLHQIVPQIASGNAPIWAALIAGCVTVIMAFVNHNKLSIIKVEMDGNFQRIIAAAEKAAYTSGVADQKESQDAHAASFKAGEKAEKGKKK